MDGQDVFNGVKASLSFYGGFFKDVALEIGVERALALHAKQGDAMGTMMGEALRAQLAGKEVTPHAVGQVLCALEQAFGMAPEVEEGPGVVRLRNRVCPFYEGWKEAGLDHVMIERLCRTNGREFLALNRTFPQVSAHLEFRSTPDGSCIEEYALAE